jgi:2'-5' RNA ligase
MTQSSERWSLFVATPVPDDRLAELERATEPLRAQWPEARWIPAANQHVTLKFLGATPVDAIVPVGEVLAGAALDASPGMVALKGFGAFPKPARARVLWAGIDDPAGLLSGLAGSLDGALEPLGFDAETRAYTPHLTLARFRAPVRIAELPEQHPAPEPFPVTEMILYRSHTSPKGARYEALAHYPLGG